MSIYLDANFIVSLYLDRQPDQVDAKLRSRSGSSAPLILTRLVIMEVINALEQTIHVSETGGQLRVSREVVAACQARFREDLETGCFQEAPIDLGQVSHHFESLSLRHTARHGFRTYDLLHVASAIALRCEAFWTFDGKARSLAELEGLETD